MTGADRRIPGLPARAGSGGLPSRVTIWEVGARDGLQNEQSVVPVAAKAEFLGRLADAGLTVLVAARSDGPLERPVAVEDRDPAVLRVGDVEVALRVGGDAAGLHELARPASGRAERPPRRQLDDLSRVVARGGVLDGHRQGLEHSAAAEVLPDVDRCVL